MTIMSELSVIDVNEVILNKPTLGSSAGMENSMRKDSHPTSLNSARFYCMEKEMAAKCEFLIQN